MLSDEDERHEKNWMPVLSPEAPDLHFVYGCSPTVVVRYDDTSDTVTRELVLPAPHRATLPRGHAGDPVERRASLSRA